MFTVEHDAITDWSAPLHSLGAVETIVLTCPACGRVQEMSPVSYAVPDAIFDWPLSRIREKARCSGMCLSRGKRVLPRVDFIIREAGDPWPEAPLTPGEADLLREWDLRFGEG
jgi:hypothetical protein